MDAPVRVPQSAFNKLVEEWLKVHAFNTGLEFDKGQIREQYSCKTCGTSIVWRRAFVSVHNWIWSECVGDGEVVHPTIPTCPKCEPNVNVFGCVHTDSPTAPPQPRGEKLSRGLAPLRNKWLQLAIAVWILVIVGSFIVGMLRR